MKISPGRPTRWNHIVQRSLFVLVVMFTLSASQAGVRINEFVAENDGALHDQDGESPDWIELYNDSALAVDLSGWRLTDTPTNMTKWVFPSTNINPGTFLVVFASGKNRATPGAELHTSFQLQNGGSYLALVEPGGTIATEFSPAYPGQRRTASYGVGCSIPAFTLLSSNAVGKYLVATSTTGNTWKNRTYNDSAWTPVTNGFGFDSWQTNATNLSVVLALDFNDRTNSVVQSGFGAFIISSNTSDYAAQSTPTYRTFGSLGVRLASTTASTYDDRVRTTPGNSSTFTESSLLRDHVFSTDAVSTGGLSVVITGLPPAAAFSATVWSFDTGSAGLRVADWFANGVLVRENYGFDGTLSPWYNEDYQFSFQTISTPTGSVTVVSRRDLSTLSGPAGQLNALRLTRIGYRAQLASDLQSGLFGASGSLYVRLPFAVAAPGDHTNVVLRARYDDGFVAYVNGTQVAARNAPGTPAWNSLATDPHLGTVWEEIPVSLPAGLLVTGANVLAIQLLNVTSTNTAMFGQFELVSMASERPGRYLWPATPGTTNGPGYSGFVADTKFSVNRGYQPGPFSLSITSATPAAAIYWTTNGTPPGPTNGTLYTAPLWISGNTWVRAGAYAPDLVPTEPETHTYLFIPEVLQQAEVQPGYPTTWQSSYPADYGMDPNVVGHPTYSQTISNDLRSLPVLSLTAPHDDFWGTFGIYRDATKIDPRYERAASAELFDPNNGTLFAINCGMEMHGNASRDNARTPKHSFRLSFKSSYGPSKLAYDWFGGGVKEFDTIVLRSLGFGDCWPTRYSDTTAVPNSPYIGSRYRPENSTYLKDHWVKESFRAMGNFGTRSDYAHLYINGLYWGLINPSERIDAESMTEHFGGREIDWDVMAGDETYNFAEVRDGNKVDWNALMSIVNAGITNQQSYELVLARIDEVGLIDFMMVHGFMEAEDWPFHNWYAAHRRDTNGLPSTEWIFMPWDQEIGMDRFVRRDKVNVDSADTPARIYSKLRAWPEFRMLYADRVQKHFFNGGALCASNNTARFQQMAARIQRAMVCESARWGDAREFTIGANPGTGITFTPDEWWRPELLELCNVWFSATNQQAFIDKLRAASLYPALSAPEFSQFGGAVPDGFTLSILHTNASGSVFYTIDGSDPREYNTGNVGANAVAYGAPVPINAPTLVRARVLDGTSWSALVEAVFYPPQDLSRLALTELMYNPPGAGVTNGDDFEFIELKNTGTNTLNLSGLNFSAGVTFTFTNGTLLEPGQFAVLVRNASVFASRYPGVPITGVYTGRLDNGGESLTLSHAVGGTIFSVSYDDLAPWPVAADGFGYSLVQRSILSQAPDDGAKWRASTNPLGSPGADDPQPAFPPVVISEILTHTDLPLVDSIELYNPTSTNAVVGGWFLTDDPATPKSYRIPDGTIITPGGYVVFTGPQIGSFLLSELGESVYLFSGDAFTNLTGYSYGFAFQAADNGVSFGRYVNSAGDETFPAQVARSLGTNNVGPAVGPVVITEIHYHPASGGDEFIEIQNISPQAVPLYNLLATTNQWRLAGVDLTFPPDTILAPGQFALLTATNAAAFRQKYGIPESTPIWGPWGGSLQDSGERIQIERPADPDTNGVGWIVVDSLRYNDKAPWPAAADGTGPSLHRIQATSYADEPLNWRAATPTPGQAAPAQDSDNDGMPDDWENLYGLGANEPYVPGTDTDGDGAEDLVEYQTGTNPRDPSSVLRLLMLSSAQQLLMGFTAGSNVAYSLERALELPAAGWTEVSNWPAASTNRSLAWPVEPTGGGAYYRVRATR